MAREARIWARVSASVKQLLDQFSAESGISKSRIVEDAVCLYVRARQELPASAIVPARLTLSERGAAAVEQSLVQPPQATPALVSLMRAFPPPGQE